MHQNISMQIASPLRNVLFRLMQMCHCKDTLDLGNIAGCVQYSRGTWCLLWLLHHNSGTSCECMHTCMCVYALGCDPGSSFFDRDCVCKRTMATTTPAMMSGLHSRQVEVHDIHIAVDQLSSGCTSSVIVISLCPAGLGLLLM